MGKSINDPTHMLFLERRSDNKMFIEFSDKETRESVRFEVSLRGVKTIIEKLTDWVNAQEQHNGHEKDPDDC